MTILSDEQFNALTWRKLKDRQIFKNSIIEDTERIGAGYWKNGIEAYDGILLYLKHDDGNRSVAEISCSSNNEVYFMIANVT